MKMDFRNFALTVIFFFAGVLGGSARSRVIAHRGYWQCAGSAQNSLASLRLADSLGVYGSEFDVHLTSDGKIVVHHDPHVGTLEIEKTTLAELQKTKLGNGETIPTLDSYLAEAEKLGIRLIIEIKKQSTKAHEDSLVRLTVEKVRRHGLESRSEYISFSGNACMRLRSLCPDADVYYLNGDWTPAQVKARGLTGIDYKFDVLAKHPGWIDECHRLGLKVNVWTVDEAFSIDKFAKAGADFITTDFPVTATRVISGGEPCGELTLDGKPFHACHFFARLSQGQKLRFGGTAFSARDWWMDPDFFRAEADGTYSFLPVSGCYDVRADTRLKYFKVYEVSDSDAQAWVPYNPATGKGTIWAIGDLGTGKPTVENASGWTDGSLGKNMPMAKVADNVYRITLRFGTQQARQSIGLCFYGGADWAGGLLGKDLPLSLSKESAPCFRLKNGTDLAWAPDLTPEQWQRAQSLDAMICTIDVSNPQAPVLTVTTLPQWRETGEPLVKVRKAREAKIKPHVETTCPSAL